LPAVNRDVPGCGLSTHIDGFPPVTDRKRTKEEERRYAELLDLMEELRLDREIAHLEKENRDRKLKEAMIPPHWWTIEREVPVRPKRERVTARYDVEVAKWFRATGPNYQARMNAVLRGYMLAMKSREIPSERDYDWKGAQI
jgi:uncharacterized protein (DUF4415 family)